MPEQLRTKPCPQCGERDATNRLEDLGHICNDCTLIFEGTAHEYAQWEYRRLAHRREKGLAP